jgi:hypothetical protein
MIQPRYEVPESEQAGNEGPPKEVPHLDTSKTSAAQPEGYFRVTHAVFWNPELRKLPGDAFRIFLWFGAMAERSEHPGGTVRASVSCIARGTGASTATVSRCLVALKESGLIVLREVNFRLGNSWWVKPVAVSGARGTRPA